MLLFSFLPCISTLNVGFLGVLVSVIFRDHMTFFHKFSSLHLILVVDISLTEKKIINKLANSPPSHRMGQADVITLHKNYVMTFIIPSSSSFKKLLKTINKYHMS